MTNTHDDLVKLIDAMIKNSQILYDMYMKKDDVLNYSKQQERIKVLTLLKLCITDEHKFFIFADIYGLVRW